MQKQEGKEEVEKAAEAPQGGIAVPTDTAHELRFEQAQREVRAGNVGIWGPPLDQQCLLADRGNGIGEGSIKCDLMAQESASPWGPRLRGRLPDERPIKGNQSGLYHVPGGAYYDVTNPEECFATAGGAKAGYEASS